MTFLKTLDRKAIEAATKVAATDDAFAKKYPALAEYMTATLVEQSPRTPSRLSVFTEEGVWKAFLNDQDAGAYVCVSAKSFSGALEALERRLASGEADWRFPKGGRRK